MQEKYEALLHSVIRYKYIFLFTFVVLIPVLTVMTVKMLNFQFFPSFDGNYLYVTGKASVDTSLEETQKVAEDIEKLIVENKEVYALKATSAVVGSRRAVSGENEAGDNMLYITMELYDMEPKSFIDRYINPVLNFSFIFNDPERIRVYHTYELAEMLKEVIEPLKDKYKLEELDVLEQKNQD